MSGFDMSQAEEASERLALMVAQYYGALIRNGVPESVAAQLSAHYQQQMLQLGALMRHATQPQQRERP